MAENTNQGNQDSSAANPQPETNNVQNLKATDAPADALTEALAQAEKFKNDFLYLRAEFENYKKGAIKERSDLVKYGSERLVVEILNAIDNFDRALEHPVTSDNYANFVKGMEMTRKELKSALSKFSVAEVPCEGAAFDPMTHEALGAEESAQIKPGHILRVFKKAYKLHDRMVRPAQVIVAKAPSAN